MTTTEKQSTKQVHIYRVDDVSWFASYSLEEAQAFLLKDAGITEEDLDPRYGTCLSEEELQRRTMYVEEDDTERTWAAQLAKNLADGLEIPFVFASSEY